MFLFNDIGFSEIPTYWQNWYNNTPLVKSLSVCPLKFIVELYSLSIFSVAKLILPLKNIWMYKFKMQLICNRGNTFENGQKKHNLNNTSLPSDGVENRYIYSLRNSYREELATFIWDDHHCNNDINKWCFNPVSLVITCTYFKVFFEILKLSWCSLILRFGLGITDKSSLLSTSEICVLNLFLNVIEFVLVHKIVQTTLTLVH